MAWEEIVFPNNLRQIRLSRGMKMTELAKRSKLSLSAVSKIEKGVRRLNQTQILNVCNILGCKLSDVFIKEDDRAADRWQDEMKRRLTDNESSGLKIFGSGLRHIRSAARKTIQQAAKDAGMTLSVYHKIETGQRELYKNELKPLAKSFGKTEKELFDEIAELYKSGKLGKQIDKTVDKVKSVLTPGKPISGADLAGNLYGAKLYDNARKKLIPVFGHPSAKGILFKKSDEQMIAVPTNFENQKSIYAVVPNVKRLNGSLPENCYVFVDSNAVAAPGDMAVLLDADFAKMRGDDTTHAQIVMLREDARGKIYGQVWGPNENIAIKNSDNRLHKVIMIVMG
jgi:transcriptional regulator with XRE-family HTH domain